jgi:D-lactate dehydrogenase
VAEHTAALVLTLNRKIHRAYARVREGNFALDGLLGFDLHGRTVGVVGTGKIGACFARIMAGFGCRCWPRPAARTRRCACARRALRAAARAAGGQRHRQPALPADAADAPPDRRRRAGADEAGRDADQHQPRRGGRHARRDRGAEVGPARQPGLDVYEEEADLFFRDLSAEVLHDDVFARLLTFPNVVVTGHQAFFTEEALTPSPRPRSPTSTPSRPTAAAARGVGRAPGLTGRCAPAGATGPEPPRWRWAAPPPSR